MEVQKNGPRLHSGAIIEVFERGSGEVAFYHLHIPRVIIVQTGDEVALLSPLNRKGLPDIRRLVMIPTNILLNGGLFGDEKSGIEFAGELKRFRNVESFREMAEGVVMQRYGQEFPSIQQTPEGPVRRRDLSTLRILLSGPSRIYRSFIAPLGASLREQLLCKD